jgi:signal transduction histidine kinase
MSVELLNEAFQHFTEASKSLETYYGTLQEKVWHLTSELEKTNRELKRAFSEAERNKDYLNAVLQSLEEAIITVDSDDKITIMNKSAEDLLGVRLQAVVGMSFNDLDCFIGSEESETTLAVNGGKYSIILSRSPIVDVNNNSRGTVILIKDITRLKELELQQERNQRLIAMGEMAAKIVHEIRNPLCSMELFASMLGGELDNENQKELARGISIGINNLNNILKNMLFFARPHKPAMQWIQMESVIDDSVRIFVPFMISRRVTVETSVVGCDILGDSELLKQVIINIIGNAIQSMPDGGKVTITTRQEIQFVVVDIQDEGEGILHADLEKIFNPFFSRKDTGTGLGLTIASTIMQAHGGYIKAMSEEGKGSTFSLYFPSYQRSTETR